jgi:Ala-tRNA(Pro) deacylase
MSNLSGHRYDLLYLLIFCIQSNGGAMAIAPTLKEYLDGHRAQYDVIPHPRSLTSMRIAEQAHVRGDNLAKAVVLKDAHGFVVAVLPATHRLDIERLDRSLHRSLDLANETELASLFRDCDVGAVPAVGTAYGVQTVLDDSLTQPADVYFEGGDHEALVHMSHEQFSLLMGGVPHCQISHRL